MGTMLMPVFRWGHAWEALHDIEREVDRILRTVDLTFHGMRLGGRYPAINLYELESEFLLVAELPGTKAEEFELTVSGGMLTMQGTRVDAEDVSDDCFRRRERFHGNWQRSISLPDRVREEGLAAEFRNGLLTIHLPKAEAGQPRRISVVEDTDT
jgi:HSP20 family protein